MVLPYSMRLVPFALVTHAASSSDAEQKLGNYSQSTVPLIADSINNAALNICPSETFFRSCHKQKSKFRLPKEMRFSGFFAVAVSAITVCCSFFCVNSDKNATIS